MAKRSKLNPRQEKFVREYVKTGNGHKSYKKAYGVNPNASRNVVDASASQLLRNPKVENAIVAHQMRARTRHDYTIDTILDELDEARAAALPMQPGAAVSASIGKARLLGMIVDRKEVGSPGEFAGLDTVQAILQVVRKELGDKAADMIAALAREPVTIDATPIACEVTAGDLDIKRGRATLQSATIDSEND